MKNHKKSKLMKLGKKRTKKTNQSKKRTHKTQRLWKQKGCSRNMHSSHKMKGGCGSCSLFKGGTACSSCALMPQQGGSKLPPLPPALVGAPWTPSISGWPGVSGQTGVTNYFSLNKYIPYDPQTQVMQERAGSLFLGEYLGGGKRKPHGSSKTKKRRGGGLIPQDLVNFGRTLTYGLGGAYNAVNGYPQPVNPLPYKDQLVRMN